MYHDVSYPKFKEITLYQCLYHIPVSTCHMENNVYFNVERPWTKLLKGIISQAWN